MRLLVLASGSSGNAVVVEAGGQTVLIDCGVSLRRITAGMRAVGLEPAALGAIVLTHEHSDHVQGLEVTARRLKLPVFATEGTAKVLGVAAEPLVPGREATIGGLVLRPVTTSHDAAEPIGVIVEHAGCRVAVVTDTGVVEDRLREELGGCHALLLECNHDPDMLRYGSYPWPLKRRIASARGHLSNAQARDTLERLAHPGLEAVIGMHLSRENNRPELAGREIERVLAGSATRVALAEQFSSLLVEVAGPEGAGANGQLGLFDERGGPSFGSG